VQAGTGRTIGVLVALGVLVLAAAAALTGAPVLLLVLVALGPLGVLGAVATARAVPAVVWGPMTVAAAAPLASVLWGVDRPFSADAPAVVDVDRALTAAALVVPAFVVAVWALVTRHRATLRPTSAETLIVTVSSSVLIWVVLARPLLDDRGAPVDPWILLGAVTVAAVAASAALLVAGLREGDDLALAVGTAAGLGATAWAVGWGLQIGRDEAVEGALVVTAIGPVLLAAAAFLADRLDRAPAVEETVRAETPGTLRLAVLTVAAFVPVVVSSWLVGVTDDPLGDPTVLLAVGASLVVLAVTLWALRQQVLANRRAAERRGERRYAALVEHSSDVVLLVEHHGAVRFASPGITGLLGRPAAYWTGRHVGDLVGPEERGRLAAAIDEVATTGPGHVLTLELAVDRADGHRRTMELVVSYLDLESATGGGDEDGVVVTVRDVTEQRLRERQLSHRAFHDELTGLANRALFLERLGQALRVPRPDHDPVVVLFVDLDDFKAVNDRLGHQAGDRALEHVAERIRRAVGGSDTAARLGGDEFAVLIDERGGVERAVSVAEHLLRSLREPIVAGTDEFTVLASIGIAVGSSGTTTTTTLLRDADIAMYEAKRAGKGQIRVFDPTMRLAVSRHLELRSDLIDAIQHEQLRLVYLPFVDLRTGRVRGAEALARWHHPVHGEIPPTEFIPVAERAGLIDALGDRVLDQALTQAATWHPDSDLFVSVNLSGVQVASAELADRVAEALRRHRVPPRMLMVEIDERTLVDDDEGARTIGRFRDLGVRVALDDFGAGHCSMALLRRSPVDVVKIDRAFVAEFDVDAVDDPLGSTMLHVAGTLGLHTVAEGVETTSQLRMLRRHGCELAQGYLLSRPLELPDLRTRFAAPIRGDEPASDELVGAGGTLATGS
jgi:diguanylate cyclase (GGDEF)-like protein/PAS domain S-box-containing protein